MPTYEYACNSCGEHLEIVQSFRDDPLTQCPACGGPLRKVFSSIGVVFKGSGFYKTDSRPSGSGKSTASSTTESTTTSTSESTSPAGSDGASSGAGSSEKSPSAEKPSKADKSSSTPSVAAS